jgi:glycosyltransferase involved in cell wall biosynthesis
VNGTLSQRTVVTISLPIYNAERFLAEALQSLKAQTLADFEVFAVLDGCTDRSEDILMDLRDERFIVVKKEHNEGKVPATNLGVFQGHAEFFGRMDADDIMHPEKLERQVRFLNEHPDIDIVGAYFDQINERGVRIRDAFPFPITHEAIRDGFRVRNSMGGPVALCRREQLVAIAGYDPLFWQAEDLELWLRCLAAGLHLANLSEVLFHHRVHVAQDSARHRAAMYELSNLAYRHYGPQIWGDDAPDVDFGAPLHRRAWRRLKRLFKAKKRA